MNQNWSMQINNTVNVFLWSIQIFTGFMVFLFFISRDGIPGYQNFLSQMLQEASNHISNTSLIYIRLSALNCDYWVVYVSGFLHNHRFRVLGTSTAAINTLYIRMVFSNLILYYRTLSSLALRLMPYNYSDFQTWVQQ